MGRGRRHSVTSETDERDIAFMEFLALPGTEVIALDNQLGGERKSTEFILGKQEEREEFVWDGGEGEGQEGQGQKKKRRRTMHARWTMRRGVGSDGRTGDGGEIGGGGGV